MAVSGTPHDDALLARLERSLRDFKRGGDSPRLHRRMAFAAGVDIDAPGFALLMRIADGEPRRLSDLAAMLWLDLSVVSRKVRQLEEQGLVERTPDADDARASRVGLSAAGKRAFDRLRAARAEVLTDLFGSWSGRDVELFVDLLERFMEDLARVRDARDAAAIDTKDPA